MRGGWDFTPFPVLGTTVDLARFEIPTVIERKGENWRLAKGNPPSGHENVIHSYYPVSLPPFAGPFLHLTRRNTWLPTQPCRQRHLIHNHRVLLIQRAAHDGFPLKWECPGGQVGKTDQTVLHGLCREVHEETGLVVKCVVEVADMLEFEGREGGIWRKITVLVALNDGEIPVVQLSADEHEDAVWATVEEVAAGNCNGREIDFAYKEQNQTMLDALRRTWCGQCY